MSQYYLKTMLNCMSFENENMFNQNLLYPWFKTFEYFKKVWGHGEFANNEENHRKPNTIGN